MKVPAPALALTAMASVQAGAALSTHLFQAVTPAGSAWLRLAIAALILLLVTRPRPRAIGWPALRGAVLLGVMTAVLTLAFIEAVARIPLGTASAIEFLGPLGVAAIGSHRRSALIWPALALAGVIGLTEPWHGQLNLAGVGFAAVSALGWAGYILLTQRVGAQLRGLHGLAISLATAALAAAPVAAWPALRGLTPVIALQALGLAALVPLLPFTLELLALRRMRVAAFGTLMALEPAMATLIGLLLLAQLPAPWQIAGITLVVTAGIGAQRTAPPATVNAAASPRRPPARRRPRPATQPATRGTRTRPTQRPRRAPTPGVPKAGSTTAIPAHRKQPPPHIAATPRPRPATSSSQAPTPATACTIPQPAQRRTRAAEQHPSRAQHRSPDGCTPPLSQPRPPPGQCRTHRTARSALLS
jgi:inner membrane transporter RhtA